MAHSDTGNTDEISSILNLDSAMQQIMRNSWPEAWLQINLPLGSTRALLAIEGRHARTPGMVAEVDILTGKKSILSYLLKPVMRARATAMTER